MARIIRSRRIATQEELLEAWERSGTPVIGCSLAALAAAQLQSGSGIPSYTIRSLLDDLDNPESGGLPRNSVLVVR